MSLPAAAFKRWAAGAGLPAGTATLSRAIGVGRTTLQAQLLRGRIEESVVIAAARSTGQDPIAALSTFDEYEDLQRGTLPPLPAEVLSQITLTDALVELIDRQNPQYGAALRPIHRWQDPPQPDSVRAWIASVDAGHIRRALSERLGIAPPNLSAQITANKLKPRHLVEAARIANTSLLSGLAAGGVITLREAGWPEGARSHAITHLRDVDLNELVQARIASAQRGARRAASDTDAAHRIQETLG